MRKLQDYDGVPGCTLYAALNLISGKWKGMILYHLLRGERRFNALQRELKGCSQRMLIKQLRELEEDGLVARTVHAVVPRRVDYRLTPVGESLGEAFCGVWRWAEANLETVLAARAGFDTRCP